MVDLTTEQELEAALAAAERRYDEARAMGASETLLIALVADIRESRRSLEREREFLRQQALAAAPQGNPM